MNLRILGTALLPLALLLTTAPQADAQSFPARQLDGRLCVFDLNDPDFGDVGTGPRVQGAQQSRKLCTGGPRPQMILVCSGQIEGWPARNLNARDNFVCEISLNECGLGTGLAEATSRQLTINRNGSARLQCTYRQ